MARAATNERPSVVFRARLLRRLLWLEVRFPVRADYGLRAAVCSCMVLDRDEGYNWYLFSLRIAGTFYGKKKRRSQIVFSFFVSKMFPLRSCCDFRAREASKGDAVWCNIRSHFHIPL